MYDGRRRCDHRRAMNVRAGAAGTGTSEAGPTGAALQETAGLPVLIAGRYQVRRLLKEGHGITTFLATDELHDDVDGSLVVVKTTSLDRLSTTAWLRLEHEAAVVSSLGSAAASGRVGVGCEDGLAFVVQPFIDGIPLEHRLEQAQG